MRKILTLCSVAVLSILLSASKAEAASATNPTPPGITMTPTGGDPIYCPVTADPLNPNRVTIHRGSDDWINPNTEILAVFGAVDLGTQYFKKLYDDGTYEIYFYPPPGLSKAVTEDGTWTQH